MMPDLYGVMLEAAKQAHGNSVAHGFWPGGVECANKAEKIALMHSELSELLEATRRQIPRFSVNIHEFTEEEEELADVVIRVLDYAGAFGLNLGLAIMKKHEYNLKRPFQHGKRI